MATKRTFPPYDPEAGKRLFDGMDAGLAVRDICRGDGMPDMETFKHWRKKSPEFAVDYAAAVERKRERQAETEIMRQETTNGRRAPE